MENQALFSFSCLKNGVVQIESYINLKPEYEETIKKIVSKIWGCEKTQSNFMVITEKIINDSVADVEIKSLLKWMLGLKILETKRYRYMFLLPVGDTGVNFGLFRIASHLISRGVQREDIIFFPLKIGQNKYEYSKVVLKNKIKEFNPDFVFATVVATWEDAIIEVNTFIKGINESIILIAGGPFLKMDRSYLLENMMTDIVIVGHGEYPIEEIIGIDFKMKSRERILQNDLTKIKGVYTKYNTDTEYYEHIIKYPNLLNWDYDLLQEVSKYTGVVNLYSSDECHGACVFCYRKDAVNFKNIGAQHLISKIKVLCNESGINRKYKYFRFLDDDFFAASDRDCQLLNSIYDITRDSIQLYELTFSIRSISKMFEKEGVEKVIKAIQKLKLKRVIVGTDGYSELDLKFFQKGYTFEKANKTIKILSQNKIPTLMYAILSTPRTTAESMYESLQNMIQVISYGSVYIGQYISPVIFLQKGNQRLESKINDEDLKFIEIDTLSLGERKDVKEAYKNARLYPHDRLARLVVKSYPYISMEDSMYIVPILNRYFEFMAMELNRINSFIENGEKALNGLKISHKKHYAKMKMSEKIWESRTEIGKDDILLANYVLKQQQIISDIENMIEKTEQNKWAFQKMKYMEIYKAYVTFSKSFSVMPEPRSLFSSVLGMAEEPIITFNKYYNRNKVINLGKVESD